MGKKFDIIPIMGEDKGENLFKAALEAYAEKFGITVEEAAEKALEEARALEESGAEDAEGSSSEHVSLINQAEEKIKKGKK